jgi:agmatine deiminase
MTIHHSPINTHQTPAALGYRMPAEWEPHAATWLSWPHRLATWPGKFEPIPPLYARLVRTLVQFEPVHILAGGAAVFAEAQALLAGLEVRVSGTVKQAQGLQPLGLNASHGVFLHDIPTNDAWTRDHGPTFLVGPPDAPPALVDWDFNSWGGKYLPFDSDNDVPRRIAQWSGRGRFTPGIILEGGAIDSNGSGTILTTEQCLLNPNRNPQLSRTDIERYLADFVAAKKVLWLGEGIVGDDTDGHVDELARFVGPHTVVASLEENSSDANYLPLRENWERLQRYTDQDNRPLEVIALPTPQPVVYQGKRLPASYCNFYLANGVAIVPQFDDAADSRVLEIFGRLLPGRQIIGLPARDLVWGRGAFHCITQQEPVC